jgi:DHA2 family multidrug resistance protein
MWRHYHFTLDTGRGDLFWPMVARGAGLGLIFVPLSQLTVADLRPAQYAQGTGLYNLSRQLGGSLGIAIGATLLSRFTEQSREALLPHLTPGAPAVQGWLQRATQAMLVHGGSPAEAQTKAYALLDLTLRRQASVVAFEKVFLTMGVALVLSLPLLLLFRTGRPRDGRVAH